jgi:flagellar biogenesis protein FliO
MKSVLLTLMIASLTGVVYGDQPGSNEMSAGYQLQAASNELLRPIPETPIYKSVWHDSTQPSTIVQTGYTSTETSTSQQADAPPAKPFLDLTTDTAGEQAEMATGTEDGTKELFMRLAVWTVIILCLCVLTMLGLRHWQRRQGILPPKAGQARVLETLAIGPGRAVSLVQLGSVRAVVGTDGSGIKTIVLAPPAFDEELDDFESEPPHNDSSNHAA